MALPRSGQVVAFQQEPDAVVAALMENMSVEDRIGQLFLVTFRGDAVTGESDIAELIRDYKVGGVVLLPENENITGFGVPEQTPEQVQALVNDLQSLALTGAVPEAPLAEPDLDPDLIIPTAVPEAAGTQLPLFIAINQPSGVTSTPTGLTPAPSNMTLGATWEPAYAQSVGELVGRDMSLLGVNMLLGPTLDVLENPDPDRPAGLGVDAIGGDPYWVGLMGQAYTTGVHLGSNNRVAVVPKHFPGMGGSDRPIADEVPTVRKSLEQLKQIELAPFVAVTGNAPGPAAVADGLFATHIRYQGFQGNIRATTAPVSFDPQALLSLMALPEFTGWRAAGGIVVSDALGLRSVERFYDDTEQEFPHRRVAKDAFLAGNDLLYLHEFALGDAPYAVQVANVRDTILWFREKYETDPAFRQRTDEAVLRILRLKLRLYGEDFSLENVLVEDEFTSRTTASAPLLFDLAQAATTLIAPSPGELAERLASPPGPGDEIVVFTDVQTKQQCTNCPVLPVIAETALAERMLALYGPQASAQVTADQITSFSFTELDLFLNAAAGTGIEPVPTATPEAATGDEEEAIPTPEATPTPAPELLVQDALSGANWIIFGLLDPYDGSRALNRFLAERPDIVRGAQVIVFAFDAPYFLDTTEISKLTAYFGLYHATSAAIDGAVRALFLESSLAGASPVSIEGVDYNLFERTQPDPDQVIELNILNDEQSQSAPGQQPLQLAVGDTLQLQTGIIVDHNGHQVPDGTIVQFIQRDRILGTMNIIAAVPTMDGAARLDYVLEASTGPGQFRITATSGEATISEEVDITIEGEAQVAIIVPTPAPTSTATPSPTPTATPTPTETPTPVPATPTPLPPPVPEEPGVRIGLSELRMLTAMFVGLLAVVGLALFISRRRHRDLGHQTGMLLWSLIGSLLLYIYLMLELPGTAALLQFGMWAGIFTTLVGGLIGVALYGLAHQSTVRRS